MLISVVTPVIDEERQLPLRAADLAAQAPPWEWIVVDGGSRDRSVDVARELGAQCLQTAASRGRQINAGAAVARGEVLVLLHADTSLPEGALEQVRAALADPDVVGGNFVLRYGGGAGSETPFDRLLTFCNGLRQKLWGTFYGDSVMFLRTCAFADAGACPQIPIMEDYELSVRMRKLGEVVRLPLEVTTSNRRYRDRPIRTLARWATIVTLYRLGASARLLRKLYPSQSGAT